MARRIRLLRPDDLLNLEVEWVNLDLDASDPAHPALVPLDAAQPAYLIVVFPPQTIAETAFFEASPLDPPLAPGEPPPDPAQPPSYGVRARIGGPTRLVFRIDPTPTTRIPYSLQSLMRWSAFALNVSPIANMPPTPTQAQVDAAPRLIVEPAATETAIELPYKLLLSPSADAGWQFAPQAVTRRGWTELWHARLARRTGESLVEPSADAPVPLRALWARDFMPGHPAAPPDPAEKYARDPELGTTALSSYDRRQIVLLTSGFHGFVDVGAGGRQTPYEPKPVLAERLMLTPLGGWLRSRGSWTPPSPVVAPAVRQVPRPAWDDFLRPARPVDPRPAEIFPAGRDFPYLPAERALLGPPLTVSEWVHVASQGRDHYVRIVYDGCLYPTKHPASLVKVTERRFRDVDGSPVAYLSQHMYVIVRRPEMEYPDNSSAAGRGMPLKRVRLTTLVTPPIAHPTETSAGGTTAFWIMTKNPATNALADFRFHGVARDVDGHPVDFSAAFIFVPDDEGNLTSVAAEYAASDGGRRRALAIPGQKVTYAKPSGGASDNTTLVTDAIYLDAKVTEGFRCPFTTCLGSADVHIPAVEQLLGTRTVTSIALYGKYVDHDFQGTTGVFAEIQGGFKVGFSADKAGGIATPTMTLKSVSREFGPLAAEGAQAATGEFKPETFFPPGTALLFGSLDLSALVKPGTIGLRAPKMQTATEDAGRKIVTTFDWNPEVTTDAVTSGIVSFTQRGGTTLSISGRIEKTVGTNADPVSQMHGELTGFRLHFARVLFIDFKSFAFWSETGKKTRIDVRLADDPMAFDGHLEFVEDLRRALPPGLFGDGPSLDVDANRIRAGFSIALPPLSVGIFALKDVKLSSGLELPFADGKPLVDFSFCERHHPFVLAVMFFGGGGFFHLQLDAGGIRQLEAALEFGAVAALDLYVASGSVHYMAGIYFSMQADEQGKMRATLAGYLRCGGEIRALGIVSVSVEFTLTLGYADPKAFGRAELTIEVELACFSKSLSVTVERKFGKRSGDPFFNQMFDTPQVWEKYATAFA
jgi:hypothetical protein